MTEIVSVIIPNYNGANFVEKCLTSVCASSYKPLEIIVVDDCSKDDSVEKIKKYPCRLIQLKEHRGAAYARNIGARSCQGDILFFTDADCFLFRNTITQAVKTLKSAGKQTVVGGTYSLRPYDHNFFSSFQAVFVHYSELKNLANPDYIATHAMALYADLFKKIGGFKEHFMPILEDVELSHRLKQQGSQLLFDPHMLVQHYFGFNFSRSWKNGLRKSRYWTFYSLKKHVFLRDSGTASHELKMNGCSFAFSFLCLTMAFVFYSLEPLSILIVMNLFNILVNRKLFQLFSRAGGTGFAIKAIGYYLFVYPMPVFQGALLGAKDFFFKNK